MEIAQWTDAYWAIATIESIMAGTDMTWLWIVLLGLGGIGFILAGLGVSGRLPKWHKASPPPSSRSVEQSPTAPQVNNKYCPQCGTANLLKAGFCTKCGNQFPSQ